MRRRILQMVLRALTAAELPIEAENRFLRALVLGLADD
jgi:hypothetical protein